MKDAKFRSLEEWREQYEPWTVHKPDLADKTENGGPTTEQWIVEYILTQANTPCPVLSQEQQQMFTQIRLLSAAHCQAT